MATDYAEKERQFIAGLEADTGRPLDAWMRAIATSGHTGRNDIIDWLREQGFTFSNASWLERIHHNGGRLIYADDAPQPLSPAPPRPANQRAQPSKPSPLATPAAPVVDHTPALAARSAPERTGTPALLPQAMLDSDVQAVLAAAKGLRPLAHLTLQAIVQAVPQTTFSCADELLILSAPLPYLAMLPTSKALRLYGHFGPTKQARVQRAEVAMKTVGKSVPPYPFVMVLDDARLVDGDFEALIRIAALGAAGPTAARA